MNHEAIARLVRELVHNSNKLNAIDDNSAALTAVKKVFANFSTSSVCLATNVGSKSNYWV